MRSPERATRRSVFPQELQKAEWLPTSGEAGSVSIRVFPTLGQGLLQTGSFRRSDGNDNSAGPTCAAGLAVTGRAPFVDILPQPSWSVPAGALIRAWAIARLRAMNPSSRRSRILSHLLVSLLTVLATLAAVTASGLVNWGYILSPQHGTYQPPSSGQTGLRPLTVNNTTLTLPTNGSWYAQGFQANATSTVAGYQTWLNVTGGGGYLTVYNLTADEFSAMKANQTFGYELTWTGITSKHINVVSYVYATPMYWVLMNTGPTSLTVTFDLNVVPFND
jgi:hypothetical protein